MLQQIQLWYHVEFEQYKFAKPEEHLHARTCHREVERIKYRSLCFENMQDYIIKLKEWIKYTMDQSL